jgi:hypothetical protein
MTARPGPPTIQIQASASAELVVETRPFLDVSRIYQQGFVAGLIGAATVALWFLLIDAFNGRPLYTPTVLGTALFRHGVGLASPETLPISFEMVWMFTWVHALLFAAIGGVASRLLALAEGNPSVGFGILLLFVVFEFGFTVAAMVLAAPVLRALTWPAVLVANLLAAATMGGYFHLAHPQLRVRP